MPLLVLLVTVAIVLKNILVTVHSLSPLSWFVNHIANGDFLY